MADPQFQVADPGALTATTQYQAAPTGTIFRETSLPNQQQFYKSASGQLVPIANVEQLQQLARIGTVKPGSDVFFEATGTVAPSVVTAASARQETAENLRDLQKMATTPVPTPPSPTKVEIPTYTEEKSALEKQIEIEQGFIDTELKQYQDLLAQQQARVAAQASAAIGDIQGSFAKRREQMTSLNQAVLGGRKIFEERTGRSRYAPELAMGLISDEEKRGIERLTDLDRQEQSAIAEAQAAADAKNFQLLSASMDVARQARQEKTRVALELRSQIADYDKLIAEQVKSAQADARAERELSLREDQFATSVQNTLTDNARQGLSIILEKFKGLRFEDLAGDDQNYLFGQATQAGIPLGVLAEGMNIVADEEDFRRNLEMAREERLAAGKTEQEIVADLASRYPDAGITLADTMTAAQAKLPRSRIYQQQTRLVDGTAGVVTRKPGEPTTAQPTSTELNKLLTNYPLEFKSYIKSIAGQVAYALDSSSIGQLYQQYKDFQAQYKADAAMLQAQINSPGGGQLFAELVNDPSVPREVKALLKAPSQSTVNRTPLNTLSAEDITNALRTP